MAACFVRERGFGREPPSTHANMASYTAVLGQAGNFQKMEQMLQQIIQQQEKN